MNSVDVVVIAGGTGGHVFPALAVAQAWRQCGYTVSWLGSTQGKERQWVTQEGFSFDAVSIQNLRGRGWARHVLLPFRLFKAVCQAYCLLKKRQPRCVIAFGGYVAGPGAIAAKCLRVPLVIHEQNAIPGLTNRVLARWANLILMGFPHCFPASPKTRFTGNPLRVSFVKQALLPYHPNQPLKVLVVGGSLGSQALNQIVPEAWALLPSTERPSLRHQTGERLYLETTAHFKRLGIEAEVIPFISNMQDAYAWADLILCRAGALTLAEIAQMGKPCIFVPLPSAADDHQRKNAEIPTAEGASLLILQTDLTPAHLAETLARLKQHPETLTQMAHQMRRLAVPDATDQVLKACQPFLEKRECP